jgi:(S)-ureidoglycine aminohydrolase
VEFEAGGQLQPAAAQRFVYVLSGTLDCASEASFNSLTGGGYAYLPPGLDCTLTAQGTTKAVIIEKNYQALADVSAPAFLVGTEAGVASTALMGDEDLQVRSLLPDQAGFDFAVNTMTYQPGAALSMVEVHVMEHGLLMLEGGGIYRLGDAWYPVIAGDFIWMAPFCPQWFGAIGKQPAKYLIYKDWGRHPLS